MREKYWDIVVPTGAKGGVENCINILTHELVKLGYKIRVIQLVSEGDVWLDEGVPFFALTYGKDGHDVKELAEKYAKFILDNGTPQVVIATNWPLCVYITKLGLAACGKKLPVLSWLHNPVARYYASGFGGYEYLGLADAHLAISDSIFAGICQNINEARVYRVNNPVIQGSDEKFEKCRATTFNHKLAFVGRITKVKGLDVILSALNLAKSDWTIDIVGQIEDDKYGHEIEELIDKLNLSDSVKRLGWQTNPWEVLKDIDFLCIPSLYEGFGLVAVEALVRGIPVISTTVGVMIETVVPGKTGYLISQQNPEELAEVLDAIDRGLLPLPLAETCKSVVIPKYEAENVAKEFGEQVDLALQNILKHS